MSNRKKGMAIHRKDCRRSRFGKYYRELSFTNIKSNVPIRQSSIDVQIGSRVYMPGVINLGIISIRMKLKAEE